jgi:hypothetical protein
MMRVYGSLIGGVLLAAWQAAPAYADCRVLRSRMFPGVESQSVMYASPGRSCGVVVHAGGRSRFDSISVVAPPQHGTLVSRIGVGVTYRSQPAFKGEDSFTYAVTGRFTGGSGTATTRIKVIVQ